MPKGTSAPGNCPPGAGLTVPVPVPSSGWTRAAGSVPAVTGGGAPEAEDGRPAAIAVVRAPNMESTDAVTRSVQRLRGRTVRVIGTTVATGNAEGGSAGIGEPTPPWEASATVSQ